MDVILITDRYHGYTHACSKMPSTEKVENKL